MGPNARQGFRQYQARERCAAWCRVSRTFLISSTEGELVRWNTDGSLFVVQTQSTLDLYTTVRRTLYPPTYINIYIHNFIQNMELIHILQHSSRIHDVKFCKRVEGEGELLLVAAENKKVSVYAVPADREVPPSIIAYMVGHENRYAPRASLRGPQLTKAAESKQWTRSLSHSHPAQRARRRRSRAPSRPTGASACTTSPPSRQIPVSRPSWSRGRCTIARVVA